MGAPDISFVCCVEAGPLEQQTTRMVESLRRFGGAFSGCNVIAVRPRVGPPILKATRQKLRDLGAEYLDAAQRRQFSWFRFLNKPLAVVAAEKACNSEFICWLDSDLLFLAEPDGLRLSDGIDFGACCCDKEMGTTGEGCPFSGLWEANCRALGLNVSNLPWLVTQREGARIRFYWNGGLFVYRRATNFGAKYLENCEKLMESRFISSHNDYGVGINEMSAIGLTVVQQQMTWQELDYSCNYAIGSRLSRQTYDNERAARVKILHYHDSMWPWFWDQLLDYLRRYNPAVADWLQPQGPLAVEMPISSRVLRKVLDGYRKRCETAYLRQCQIV